MFGAVTSRCTAEQWLAFASSRSGAFARANASVAAEMPGVGCVIAKSWAVCLPFSSSGTGLRSERGWRKCHRCLTTRSSGPGNIVGRVWPRHSGGGRPLNSVVIRRSVRAEMHSQYFGQRAANPSPSITAEAVTSHNRARGASLGWGVVMACSRASAQHRFYKVCKSAGTVVLARLKHRLPGLRLASVRSSVAGGDVTYNYAFERTGGHRGPRLSAARAAWPAAQRGR